jgi:hypothetical protein
MLYLFFLMVCERQRPAPVNAFSLLRAGARIKPSSAGAVAFCRNPHAGHVFSPGEPATRQQSGRLDSCKLKAQGVHTFAINFGDALLSLSCQTMSA